jgi:hypothetical protein
MNQHIPKPTGSKKFIRKPTKTISLPPLKAEAKTDDHLPDLEIDDRLETNAEATPEVTIPAVEEGVVDPRDLPGWSVIKLHDEATGKGSYQFTMPNSIGGRSECELSMALTVDQMVRELRAYGELPVRPATAKNAVERLIGKATTVLIRSVKPGWKPEDKPTAFVLPNAIIPTSAGYRWSSAVPSRLGEANGTSEAWNKEVGQYGKVSNYIAFGIMAALASPLVRFANLSESAVFNLYGRSSVGKTTVARVAMSTIGPAECMQNWDLKARALEEAASKHNDCPLILNGAERLSPTDLKQFVMRVVHMLPDGGGTTRSIAVHDQLPNATWRNVVLSTSNLPGREMGGRWEEQESVRFIDIPVPPVKEGGIFDTGGADAAGRAAKAEGYLAKIEAGITANYGVVWPLYIEHLLTLDVPAVVSGYMQEYLALAEAAPGIEERIAKKFALVFAAGRIAQAAGLLPWQTVRVTNAVRLLHKRSIAARRLPSDELKKALGEIASATSPLIRDLSQNTVLKVSAAGEWIGVRTTFKGIDVIGVRRDDLSARYRSVPAGSIIGWLEQHDLIVGDRQGTQPRITLTVGATDMSRARFIFIDIKKMKGALT